MTEMGDIAEIILLAIIVLLFLPVFSTLLNVSYDIPFSVGTEAVVPAIQFLIVILVVIFVLNIIADAIK